MAIAITQNDTGQLVRWGRREYDDVTIQRGETLHIDVDETTINQITNPLRYTKIRREPKTGELTFMKMTVRGRKRVDDARAASEPLLAAS